jgi:hypothetical protein
LFDLGNQLDGNAPGLALPAANRRDGLGAYRSA